MTSRNIPAGLAALIAVAGCLSPASAVVIDAFSDTDLSEYTLTILNDGNVGTSNVAFSSPSGSLVTTYSGTTTHEQLVFLRDDHSLAVGQTLVIDTAITSTTTLDFGLAIAATATPAAAVVGDADSREETDWFSISARVNGSGGFVRANSSVSGAVVTATLDGGFVQPADLASITGLFITRVTNTQFVAGYIDASDTQFIARTVDFGGSSTIGNAVGFYADLRAAGNISGFDNLAIVPEPSAALLGALGMLGILRRRRI